MDIHGSLAWLEMLDYYLNSIYKHCSVAKDNLDALAENLSLEDVDFDELDLGKCIEPAN